jgi:hypothetical protein
MRQFLLDTYSDYLQTGAVILDVAGGKGDLSWLLANVDDLDSVVVDPRLTKNHILKSVEYLRANPDQARERAIPNQPTHQPLATLLPKLNEKNNEFVEPRHLRLLVDQHLVDAIRKVMPHRNAIQQFGDGSDWARYWHEALQRGQDAQTLGYKEQSCPNQPNNQLKEAKEALQTIMNARLIVGFHPDQATDFCVELAKELQVPFCIVPCCVFPSEFPHRRLEDGTRVRTHEQLLCYLKAKAPNARVYELQFHETATAKNVALYTLPEVSPL